MAFLLILLDVVAELRIHKRIVPIATTVFHVLRPKKLLVNSVPKQLLLDVLEVRHSLCTLRLWLLGEHDRLQLFIGHVVAERPADPQLLCPVPNLNDGFLSDTAARHDVIHRKMKREEPQYLTVLGHL